MGEALEASSLMAVGLAGMRGRYLLPRHALAFAGTKAGHVLALSAHMVLRILVALVPFLLAGGLVYALLLREHDINYYISDRPPEFWIAVVLVGVTGAGLVALLLRTIARWSLALQLVLFDNVPPRRALGASAARTKGHRAAILVVLATWVVFALVTTALVTVIVDFLGLSIAPLLAHRLGLLLQFVTALLLLWAALALAVAVVNDSLFALALAGLYKRVGDAALGSLYLNRARGEREYYRQDERLEVAGSLAGARRSWPSSSSGSSSPRGCTWTPASGACGGPRCSPSSPSSPRSSGSWSNSSRAPTRGRHSPAPAAPGR